MVWIVIRNTEVGGFHSLSMSDENGFATHSTMSLISCYACFCSTYVNI